VFREARIIQLKLASSKTRQPLAQLLHRACSLSAGGLALKLDVAWVLHKDRLLADLFSLGIQHVGWVAVAELVLKVGVWCQVVESRSQITGSDLGSHPANVGPSFECRDHLGSAHLPSWSLLPSQHCSAWS
jgi:hypothetical protein